MNLKTVKKIENSNENLKGWLINYIENLKKKRKLTKLIREKDPEGHLQNYSLFASGKQNWTYEKIIEIAKKITS
jgi:hypothetical protein